MQSLSCRRCRSLLSPYRDGELALVQRRTVEQHLSVCDSCQGYMRQLNRTLGTLALLDEDFATPAAQIRDRVWEAIRGITLSQEARANLPTEELAAYTSTAEVMVPDARGAGTRAPVLVLSLLLAVTAGLALWLALRDGPDRPAVADKPGTDATTARLDGGDTRIAEAPDPSATVPAALPELAAYLTLCERGHLLREAFATGLSLAPHEARHLLLPFATAMAQAASADERIFLDMAEHPEFPAAALFARTQAATARGWRDALEALPESPTPEDVTALAWRVERAQNLIPPWAAVCLGRSARPLEGEAPSVTAAPLPQAPVAQAEDLPIGFSPAGCAVARLLAAVTPDPATYVFPSVPRLMSVAEESPHGETAHRARYWLARTLWRQGRFPEAVAQFNQVPGDVLLPRLDPASVEALQASLQTELVLWALAHGVPMSVLQRLPSIVCYWQAPARTLADGSMAVWTEVSLSTPTSAESRQFTSPTQEYFSVVGMIRLWQGVNRLLGRGREEPHTILVGQARLRAHGTNTADRLIADAFPDTAAPFAAVWMPAGERAVPIDAQTVSGPEETVTFWQRGW